MTTVICDRCQTPDTESVTLRFPSELSWHSDLINPLPLKLCSNCVTQLVQWMNGTHDVTPFPDTAKD